MTGGSKMRGATVLLGLLLLSAGCWASESSEVTTAPRALPPTLADIVVLSDAAMARETGTSLRPPTIGHESTGHPTVLLWDELKTAPQVTPGQEGSTTVTIGVGR
jgi:hypothetical protein